MSEPLTKKQISTNVNSDAVTLPRKVVVLGGGMGSLSAVFQLTRENDWKSRYDITVYQIGWRLGGKGASGRSSIPEYHHRIEEHGVHVFFGFYTNAFRLMEACYKELGRPPGSLLETWQDAFKGSNNVVLAEQMPNKTWVQWDFHPPRVDGQPTDDRSHPHLGKYVETIARWATQELAGLFGFSSQRSMLTLPDAPKLLSKLNVHAAAILPLAEASQRGCEQISSLLTQQAASTRSPDVRTEAASEIDEDIEVLLDASVSALRLALGLYWTVFSQAIREADSELEQQTRRTWILCNFIYANLNGIHSSRLFENGIECINELDYRAWLLSHCMEDNGVMGDSSLVRWLYDALFAYRSGAIDAPSLEAGTAVLTAVRLLFTYNGDFLYKMQAGMGDVVFAPLYEVLQRRGVKFAFFNRVLSLEVENKTGVRAISRILLERQAKTDGPYKPLSTITDSEGRSLDCWPAEPDFTQLHDGEALRKALSDSGKSLENYADSPHGERVSLERDQFDDLLFGIGLGSVPETCANLISSDSRWKDMTSMVGSVATLGAQLWLNRDLLSLVPDVAAPLSRPAIFCAFDYDEEPVNSYADMTQVLRRECWPPSVHAPKSIAYFCSVLRDENDSEQSPEAVRNIVRTMLGECIRELWPGAWTAAGTFDWSCLVDQRQAPSSGEGKLEAQYFVGVANPSDRYVASFAGSSRYRLLPNETGFENLVLTGDWVQNTFNVGCIESSVMSGLQAANVISGFPLGKGIAGWGIFSKSYSAGV